MGLGEWSEAARAETERTSRAPSGPHTATHAELRAVITCTQIHRKLRKRSRHFPYISTLFGEASSLFTQLLLKTADQLCGVVGGVVALCLVAGVAFLIFKKKTTGGSVRGPKTATTVAPE